MNLEKPNSVNLPVGLPQIIYRPPVRQNSVNNLIFIRREDGKIVAMTREEFIQWINSRRNNPPKPDKQEEPYELGPQKGNKRIIDVDNVSEPTKTGTTAPKENACPAEKIQEYENNIANSNGQIDDFRQGKRGDCYLLASIQSIRQTKEGQEILRNNVKETANGFTVTLPGAVAARNHYIEQGYEDKCAITGQYTITKAAIEKAQSFSGKSYAYGDFEVIALELAMEAFRAEVVQTNKALGQKSQKYIAGQFGPMSESDTLAGGQMYDAVYILTGQKSDYYEAKKSKRKNAKLYIPGEYGYIDQTKDTSKKKALGSAKGIVEVNHVYNKESDLQKMLDKYKGKEGEYSITVGVIVGKNGPDGSTKAGGGHAMTVTKITDDYVEVVNPWDTTKKERIPRGDFEQMAVGLNVAPMSKKAVDKFYEQNGLEINNDTASVNNNYIQNIINNLLNPFRLPFLPISPLA